MSSRARLASVVALSALAFPVLALADAEPQAQTRATIHGTGKDVSIVYRSATTTPAKPGPAGAPAGSTKSAAPAPSMDVVSEATRLAERGADDRSILTYLRAHEAELPDIVGNDALRKLRKAGASPEVISELSRIAALDIGETAEGAPQSFASAESGYASGAGYDVPTADMGYPFYGSYGGYGGYGAGRGFGRRNAGGKIFGSHHPGLPVRPMPHGMGSRPTMHMSGGMGGMHSGAAHVGSFGSRRP